MAWEKIVKRIGVRACPECQNPGFEFQDGVDLSDDEKVLIVCPDCGWKGTSDQLVTSPGSAADQDAP